MDEKTIKPIGIISTDFKEKFGIPRQSGRVKSARGIITLFPPYNNKESLKGLNDFSHIWLIFDFTLANSEKFSPTVRPPRLGGNKRIGVFASRSPFRPNGLGLSSVKLERINNDNTIEVSGVDILDGTPIYDIKPYIPYADIHNDATGSFAQAEEKHRLIIKIGAEKLECIPKEKKETVIDCLCDDPRPAYQNDGERVYSMLFLKWDIHFKIKDNEIEILNVEEK